MTIENAQYVNEEKTTIQADIDGVTFFIHADSESRHYRMLEAWVAEGNTIADYVPPPIPTAEEQAHADFISGISSPFMQALLEETGQTQAIKDRLLANAKLPEWDAAKTDYMHGDKVRHIGYVWVCLDDGTTSPPDFVPGDWELA